MAEINTLFAARFVVHVALGMWLGKIVFFSFFGAPQIFDELDRGLAGEVVNSIFPWYYLMGIVLGVVATVGAVGIVVVSGFGVVTGVVVAGAVIGTLIYVYSRQVLIPKMDEATGDAFDEFHELSVRLNSGALVVVTIALIASHM